MNNLDSKIKVTRKDDGTFCVEVGGMKETFKDYCDIDTYASSVLMQAQLAIMNRRGRYYVRDISNERVAIVHNQTKQALALNNYEEVKDYCKFIRKKIDELTHKEQ